MFDRLREDVRTARETDPAAKSSAEVLLYAGVHAVWAYRLAHWLWTREFHFTARLLSQLTRFFTGVEIHPGADLGRRVFVDHGMGVVIGETAEVGDDVAMYHGVTLGGDDPRPVKRHPTVGDRVTLGANATLVGDITVGDDATVGAGAVVVEDVPPGATVVGNPAEVVDGDDAGTEPESATTPEAAEGSSAEPTADEPADDETATPPDPPACCGAAGAS
nr:serine O-acetyltransferase [Halosimplex halophilum]